MATQTVKHYAGVKFPVIKDYFHTQEHKKYFTQKGQVPKLYAIKSQFCKLYICICLYTTRMFII